MHKDCKKEGDDNITKSSQKNISGSMAIGGIEQANIIDDGRTSKHGGKWYVDDDDDDYSEDS